MPQVGMEPAIQRAHALVRTTTGSEKQMNTCIMMISSVYLKLVKKYYTKFKANQDLADAIRLVRWVRTRFPFINTRREEAATDK
jgi:hypothetical protein